ncbi:dipeptide ABC transporter ATP-binding protein [Herbiconiux sp. YIM B11900]|uniref:dipeptide ABC transporter ATP-binding protein n=1 Tax=Herbiconiux sp. YIM B11900 TaxID=3404131 RepID=UPI003F8624E0
MTQPTLRVSGLTVSFGATPVVADLDLTLAPGEVVALVGESGSGKSTTARAILGLLPPEAEVRRGEVALDGIALLGLSPRQLRPLRGRRIGYVPQDPASSLDPVQRIGRQVAEVFRVHGIGSRADRRGRVVEALRTAGIDEPERRMRQFPHELSGGLQQRALIAIALAASPQLLVADEPTSALDVTVQKEILDNLAQSTASRGTSVLLITHDLGVAAERADRIVVLNAGRIVEQGPARTVLTAPQHEYTRRLVAATPSMGAASLTVVDRQPHTREAGPFAQARDASAPPLLTVTDLVKDFGSAARRRRAGRDQAPPAVDGVGFELARGTTFALVGESGSGKTTTARIIARLETATSGSVVFDGADITTAAGERLRLLRRRIQFVHQNPHAALDPRFTVAEAIGEPLRAFGLGDPGERRRRAGELLDRVALPTALLDRGTARLSGGQAQRVAIARALAPEPEFVVLDEAVSALDVSVQAQILELLAGLKADLGLSYLFISHDLAVVAEIADEVAVMRGGRLIERGSPRQVFAAPADPYTQRLVAAVPGTA